MKKESVISITFVSLVIIFFINDALAYEIPFNELPIIHEGLPDETLAQSLPIEWNTYLSFFYNERLTKAVLSFDPGNQFVNQEDKIESFIEQYSDILDLEDIELRHVHTENPQEEIYSSSISVVDVDENSKVGHVIYEQIVTTNDGEIPILGSFAFFGLSKRGKITSMKFSIYDVSTIIEYANEHILSEEAIEIARNVLATRSSQYISAPVIETKLVGFPVKFANAEEEKPILAYEISFGLTTGKDSRLEKLKLYVDALSGQILTAIDTLVKEDIVGSLSTEVYPFTPEDRKIIKPLKNTYVAIRDRRGNILSINTDSNGQFEFRNVDNPRRVQSVLSSDFANVIRIKRRGVEPIEMSRPSRRGYEIEWSEYDSTYKQEATNVYAQTLRMHDYAIDHGLFFMDYPMDVYINHDDVCNAYYDPADGSTNYFRRGRYRYEDLDGNIIDLSCEASSLYSKVIYHEYGHAISDGLIFIYWPYYGDIGNINEAISDYIASSVSKMDGDQNYVCLDSFIEGEECTRVLNNGQTYPEDLDSEPHSATGIISHGLYDIKIAFEQKYGEIGSKKADLLVFDTLRNQPVSYHDFVDSMILANDDNDYLGDGTPDIDIICDSFEARGLNSLLCSSRGYLLAFFLRYEFGVSKLIRFVGSEPLDIYGVVLGSDLKEWTLELEHPDLSRDLLTRSTENVRGVIYSNFDFGSLPVGTYHLILRAEDNLGSAISYHYQVIIINNLKIIIEGNEDIGFVRLDLLYNNENTLDSSDLICNPNYCEYMFDNQNILRGLLATFCDATSCEINFPFRSEIGGLVQIVTAELINELNELEVEEKLYIFLKDIPISTNNLELNFDTAQTTQMQMNDEEIFNDYNLRKLNLFNLYTPVLSTSAYFHRTRNGEIRVFADESLAQRNLPIRIVSRAENRNTKKSMNLHYVFNYPYVTSRIENEEIQIQRILHSKSLNLEDRSFVTANYDAETGHYYSGSNFHLRNNEEDTSLYYNIPNGIERTYLGFTASSNRLNPPSNPYGYYLNYVTSILLDEVIEAFKTPFSLRVQADRNKLIGQVLDANGEVLELRGYLPFVNLCVFAESGERDCSAGTYYGYIVNWQYQPLRGAQEGKYIVEWVFSEIDFRNPEETPSYRGEFYYDGNEFTLIEEEQGVNLRGVSPEQAQVEFSRGDFNDDGRTDISDAISTLNWLFREEGEPPFCMDIADTNDDGAVDISDPIHLLLYLFRGGEKPAQPFDQPGFDNTLDNLECNSI